MPSDESKGSQLDAIGSLAQRQLDNTVENAPKSLSRHDGAGRFSGRGVFDPVLEPETDRPVTDLLEAATRLIAHGIW